MNSLAESAWAWRHFYGVLAIATTCVVGCLWLAQRKVSSPSLRRTMWQTAFLGLGWLAVVELSGLGRALPQPFRATPSTSATAEETWGSWRVISGGPTTSGFSSDAGPAQRAVERVARPELNRPGIEWPSWLWWAGFLGVSLWLVGARLILWAGFRRRRGGQVDSGLRQCVEQLTLRLGLPRWGWRSGGGVRLEEIQGLVSPIAYGIFRPTVGLPPGFPSEFGEAQRQAMLAHELAHLAARDPFWQAVADAVTALLWWHPLVWVARSWLRAAAESAADEASLVVDNGPEALAESLVTLGARVRQRSAAWLGVEGGEFRSDLGKRVVRLWHLRGQPWRPWRPGVSSMFRWAGVLLIGTLAWFGTARTGWVAPRATWPESFHQSVLGQFFSISQAAAAELPRPIPAPPSRPVRPPQPAPPPPPAPGPGPSVPSAVVANAPRELHTRWFRVDESTLRSSLRAWLRDEAASAQPGAGANELVSDLLKYLAVAGADLSQTGRQLLYNERSGVLMARANLAELELLEQTIQVLNTSPAQVLIEVRLCEVSEEVVSELSSKVTAGQPVWALLGKKPVVRTADNPGSNSLSCILTGEQFREVLEGLEKQPGVNLLSAPRVTTLSGRQAQIKAVSLRYIVTDLDFSTNRPPPNQSGEESVLIQPVAQPFELGPVVDLVPEVWSDNQTIGLRVLASIKEFLGYDNEPAIKAALLSAGQAIAETPAPLPRFRLRQLQTLAAVNDGQTLVLAGSTDTFPDVAHMTEDHPPASLAQEPGLPSLLTKSVRKKLIVFVTPTLIDPAGNAIHGTRQ